MRTGAIIPDTIATDARSRAMGHLHRTAAGTDPATDPAEECPIGSRSRSIAKGA